MVIRIPVLQCLFALILTTAALAEPQKVSQALEETLSAPTPLTVYSIYPEPASAGPSFLGYPVLGRAVLDVESSREIGQAVLQGLKEADPSVRQSCFAPRHGIEMGGSKLLICYACSSVVAEFSDGQKASYAIGEAGHRELAEAVFRQGLKWQSWQPVEETLRHHSGLAIPNIEGFKAEVGSGSETLSLTGRKETVQLTPTPGSVVLESESGQRESISTQWLDHAETGSPIWYLTGLSSSYDDEDNRRTCTGNAFELERIKAFLQESDKPARYRTRMKVRPDSSEADLDRQLQELRRQGYKLRDEQQGGVVIKTGTGSRSGIPMTVFAGLIETSSGPVLLTAEVPGEQRAPLSSLVRSLSGK
ncbi:MAG: hypothetical protein KC800_15300 [Candidatus Eremiobacteraeota bacterium]|nr:hypothetical protein [Candidatus Eremiobacteraeota bacterium]